MTEPPASIGLEMSEGQRRSFLESKGHGVLSMGVENRGYGFPISYSYDRETDRVVLGFTNTAGSKKRDFATETQEVTLNVYEFKDVDSWKSVVVRGTLQEVEEPVNPDRPMSMFFLMEDGEGEELGEERRIIDLEEFDRTWFELEIEEVSGRHSG